MRPVGRRNPPGGAVADPTTEQLDELLELATTDAELRRLHKRLDELPEQQQLDAAIQELEDRSGSDDRDAGPGRRAGRGLPGGQAGRSVAGQRLEAEQQRLYGGEISNAKELQSMRAEIESVQRRIDEHEDAELEAMERAKRSRPRSPTSTAGSPRSARASKSSPSCGTRRPGPGGRDRRARGAGRAATRPAARRPAGPVRRGADRFGGRPSASSTGTGAAPAGSACPTPTSTRWSRGRR